MTRLTDAETGEPSRTRGETPNAFPENELPRWLFRQSLVQAQRAVFALRSPPYKQLARFSSDLATCVDSSADIVRGLELCLKPLRNTPIGNRLTSAVDQVRDGASFADALRPAKDLFPPFYLPVLVAGEQAGRLGESLRFLENHCKLIAGPATALRNLWLFPIAIMLAGEAIQFVLTLLMGDVGIAITFLFQCLFSWLQLGVIVAIVVLTPIRYFLDQIRLSLPLIGQLEREIALHRFFRVLSLLYAVGGHRVESMIETSAKTVTNNAARLDLLKAAKAIQNKATVADAFHRVSILSSDEQGTIETGDLSGTLELAFSRISDDTGRSMIAKLELIEWFLIRIVLVVVTLSVLGTLVGLIVPMLLRSM